MGSVYTRTIFKFSFSKFKYRQHTSNGNLYCMIHRENLVTKTYTSKAFPNLVLLLCTNEKKKCFHKFYANNTDFYRRFMNRPWLSIKVIFKRYTIIFITKNCSMTCLKNIRLILKISFKIVFSVHFTI